MHRWHGGPLTQARHVPQAEGSSPVTGGWEGFTWINEPARWAIDATGQLGWDTRPISDFWRNTGGVVGADDGDAFLRECVGDFAVRMQLNCHFESPYDQCGLMVRVDERNWLKAGIELDGGAWFSVVETHENSDWSKQASSGGGVEFAVWREGDTLRVGLVVDGVTQLVRELLFDGPVTVGPYSCAPKGQGFPVYATMSWGSDGAWQVSARAGEVASS